MPVDLKDQLVVGVSSRALFNLAEESIIFERDGLEAYKQHQREREGDILLPGPAFPLVRALLKLNEHSDEQLVEVVVMSKNSLETYPRIQTSIEHHGLPITRVSLTGGAPTAPYLKAFCVNLFLSKDKNDVLQALKDGYPAAILYDSPINPEEDIKEIRIAFDGDAILFSDESEAIFQSQGLEAFQQNETDLRDTPLKEGPFASLLHALSKLQKRLALQEIPHPISIRTALVTARGGVSILRPIKTLRAWEVEVNEGHFLGGVSKAEILRAFNPHIFFDDYDGHCMEASQHVPSGHAPSDARRES